MSTNRNLCCLVLAVTILLTAKVYAAETEGTSERMTAYPGRYEAYPPDEFWWHGEHFKRLTFLEVEATDQRYDIFEDRFIPINCKISVGIKLHYNYCRWWGCQWRTAGETMYKEINSVFFQASGPHGRTSTLPFVSTNNNSDLWQSIDLLPGDCRNWVFRLTGTFKAGDSAFPGESMTWAAEW